MPPTADPSTTGSIIESITGSVEANRELAAAMARREAAALGAAASREAERAAQLAKSLADSECSLGDVTRELESARAEILRLREERDHAMRLLDATLRRRVVRAADLVARLMHPVRGAARGAVDVPPGSNDR
jgi:hypothetical protein